MLELLKHHPLCVNALANALRISPAAVSQHLRVMRDANLVEAVRKGYFVHYRVCDSTLADWNERIQVLLSRES